MGLINLFFQDPKVFIVLAVLLLYSVIFHEVAHGVVAYWFGDTTAKNAGRISLNPVSHIDPIGTLMLLIVGFGWARPVPVNFFNLRNYRVGLVCVALAGCFTNILIATGLLLFCQLRADSGNSVLIGLLFTVARINIMLGAFNLIPIPPLDGSKVLMGFLPTELQHKFARIEPYGFFILILLLMTHMLDPVIAFAQGVIGSLIVFVLGFAH